MHNDLSSLLNALDGGFVAEVAESLYWQQYQQIPEMEQNPKEFLFRLGAEEAILFWREVDASPSRRAKFSARLIYGRVESASCEGWLTFSLVGSPRVDQAFPYIVVGSGGGFEGMEFLQRFCFRSLDPLRKFLTHIEAHHLIERGGVREEDFLCVVDPRTFRVKPSEAVAIVFQQPAVPFRFTEPLPY